MKKFLLISVLLGTLVFGQKNNHSSQASPTVQQISTETSSVSATVPSKTEMSKNFFMINSFDDLTK
jgi:hypothetical protein